MAATPQIDTRELTRTARAREGRVETEQMERLASLLARDEGQLDWRVRGERRARPDGGSDDLMFLELRGQVTMQCVRCLGDVEVPLEAQRGFRLVASEEQAAREDLEDAEYDVLVGGARFDLAGLIEDEAIMALPPMPRHEDCRLPELEADERATPAANGNGLDPDQAHESGGDRIRPFANLAELTKRGR